MEGRISKGGVATGVVLIAIGVVVAWLWLGDSELGESPVDAAAGTGELGDEQEGDVID